MLRSQDYDGADGQVLRQSSADVLMYGVCVRGWRLRDDCLAASRQVVVLIPLYLCLHRLLEPSYWG